MALPGGGPSLTASHGDVELVEPRSKEILVRLGQPMTEIRRALAEQMNDSPRAQRTEIVRARTLRAFARILAKNPANFRR